MYNSKRCSSKNFHANFFFLSLFSFLLLKVNLSFTTRLFTRWNVASKIFNVRLRHSLFLAILWRMCTTPLIIFLFLDKSLILGGQSSSSSSKRKQKRKKKRNERKIINSTQQNKTKQNKIKISTIPLYLLALPSFLSFIHSRFNYNFYIPLLFLI